jgi:hypothetical protein
MPLHTLQVTIGASGKTQFSTLQRSIRYINIQNNGATNTMRVGSDAVSATVGHKLATNGGEITVGTNDIYFCYISDFWVQGTAADVVDVTYIS